MAAMLNIGTKFTKSHEVHQQKKLDQKMSEKKMLPYTEGHQWWIQCNNRWAFGPGKLKKKKYTLINKTCFSLNIFYK